MEEKDPETMGEPGDVAIRHHIQTLLPKHLRNPYKRIRPEMGRQGNSLHHQGNNHPKVQQVQNQVQKGILWDCKGIQRLLE